MIKLLLVLGCLCLASASASSPPSNVPSGMGATVTPPSDVPSGMGPTVSPPSHLSPGMGSPTSAFWSNPDWLSSDVALVTYYGPYNTYYGPYYYGPYGYPTAVEFYDERLLHDEWYRVARSFLDGTTYGRYYYSYSYPIYLDRSWWGDPRGYRPLYRINPGYVLKDPS